MVRDRRGWAKRLDRSLLPFMGPAQIGAGYDEEPVEHDADHSCPICGRPMSTHTIERFGDPGRATRLHCPPRV